MEVGARLLRCLKLWGVIRIRVGMVVGGGVSVGIVVLDMTIWFMSTVRSFYEPLTSSEGYARYHENNG